LFINALNEWMDGDIAIHCRHAFINTSPLSPLTVHDSSWRKHTFINDDGWGMVESTIPCRQNPARATTIRSLAVVIQHLKRIPFEVVRFQLSS